MDIPGSILLAEEAKPILEAANVSRETDIGEGYRFEYKGNVYWILQTGIKFPWPTDSSPDGWHIVYRLTEQEEEAGKPPSEKLGLFEKTQPYIIVLIVIAALFALGYFVRAVK